MTHVHPRPFEGTNPISMGSSKRVRILNVVFIAIVWCRSRNCKAKEERDDDACLKELHPVATR